MKIVIDAFGGDNAPLEIVEGAVLSVNKHKDISIILCGDENKINKVLNGRTERIEVVHAPDVISNDDVPTEAIRNKKDSSLVKAFEVLKEDNEAIAMVSAGSTGAILTGAIMKIGRIKGVSRPSLAPVLPTRKQNGVLLIDSGANIDCKPEQLCQFAIMGSAYYSIIYGVENPRVGLLNIGTEEHKGNAFIKETYPLFKNLPVNFIGNVEAREYMSGDVDVLVTDGFAGNVLLKGVEGAVGTVLKLIKGGIKESLWAKIGYALFMQKTFGKLKDKLDIKKHGGSPFLGCKKLIMKNHGSSLRSNILASVDQAILLHNEHLNEKIEKIISEGKIDKK